MDNFNGLERLIAILVGLDEGGGAEALIHSRARFRPDSA